MVGQAGILQTNIFLRMAPSVDLGPEVTDLQRGVLPQTQQGVLVSLSQHGVLLRGVVLGHTAVGGCLQSRVSDSRSLERNIYQ